MGGQGKEGRAVLLYAHRALVIKDIEKATGMEVILYK